MTLNWFSPLPPAKTDVANYTARILPALQARASVRLWTESASSVRSRADAAIFSLDHLDWAALNSGGLNVYNIGNNAAFHSEIWRLASLQPGLVILHDSALQHLFAGYFVEMRKEPDRYRRLMADLYGVQGENAAELFLRGDCNTELMAAAYPMTSLAIRNALGVIVHNSETMDEIRKQILCPAVCLPLPYLPSVSAEAGRRQARRERCSFGPPFQIAIFGHIGPNRRVESVLAALGSSPVLSDNFHLHILGAVWDSRHLLAEVDRHKLTGRVHLHGYVEDLDHHLANADLVVNLRYPTMGEASGTQLRTWDNGLPSLVSRVGWYAKLPVDCVYFVRTETEMDDIRTHLENFLKDPISFRVAGERGRTILLENHSPERYAEGVLEMANAALDYSPYHTGVNLAARLGALVSPWLSREIGPAASLRIAHIISSLSAAKLVRQNAQTCST